MELLKAMANQAVAVLAVPALTLVIVLVGVGLKLLAAKLNETAYFQDRAIDDEIIERLRAAVSNVGGRVGDAMKTAASDGTITEAEWREWKTRLRAEAEVEAIAMMSDAARNAFEKLNASAVEGYIRNLVDERKR